MAANSVRILTSQLVGERGSDQWERHVIERDVQVADIASQFTTFLTTIQAIFFQDMGESHHLLLDEIHVNAQIDGNGAFRLLGSSNGSASGGISLIIRRRRSEDTADVSELHLNTPHKAVNIAGMLDGDTAKPLELAGPGQNPVPVQVGGKLDVGPGPLTVI